jgi:hypothetical protein
LYAERKSPAANSSYGGGSQYGQNGGYSTATTAPSAPYGGGYTVAESSPYPPVYSNSGSTVPAAGANTPASYQYQPEQAASQYNSPANYASNVYSGTEYQATSATTYQQPNSVVPNQAAPAPAGNNYAPFGTAAQQPAAAAPYGYGEQPASNPYTYGGNPNTGIPTATPAPPSGYTY